MTQRLTDQAKQPGADSMRPIRMATTLLWWSGRVRNRLLWLLYGRTMRYEYDKANDVAYVRLKAGKVARTQALDDWRLGVEFIGVRGGVETDDLPNQEAVAKLLSKHKVKVKAYA
jgi:Protein of unknown function (DUF2283)